MSEFNHIASDMSRRKSDYDEVENRRALKLWLFARYVRGGYLAAFPHSTTAILIAILNVANFKTRKGKCRIRRLMKESGVKNRNTAFKAIKWLEELRIISITRVQGESHIYALNKSSIWLTLPTGIKNDN